MKPSQILHKAQQLLLSKPGGKAWCKGHGAAETGARCAIYAVYEANSSRGWDPRLRVYLERVRPEPFWNVEQFNDDPDTTLWDVVVLFRKAINLAESEGQ